MLQRWLYRRRRGHEAKGCGTSRSWKWPGTNPPLRRPEEPALRHAAFSPVRPMSNVDHTEVPEDTLLWKPLTGHWLQQPQDTRPPFRGRTPPHLPPPSTTQAPCSLTGPLGYCRSPSPSQAHPPPRPSLATPMWLSESPQCGPSLPGLPVSGPAYLTRCLSQHFQSSHLNTGIPDSRFPLPETLAYT